MPAVPVHHTPTVDTPWDGPAAVAAAPNDSKTLTYMAAWRDPAVDPDLKSAYAEWHHAKQGAPANLPGVRNALARLTQSRIPASDYDGVRRHLQAHLDDANS